MTTEIKTPTSEIFTKIIGEKGFDLNDDFADHFVEHGFREINRDSNRSQSMINFYFGVIRITFSSTGRYSYEAGGKLVIYDKFTVTVRAFPNHDIRLPAKYQFEKEYPATVRGFNNSFKWVDGKRQLIIDDIVENMIGSTTNIS